MVIVVVVVVIVIVVVIVGMFRDFRTRAREVRGWRGRAPRDRAGAEEGELGRCWKEISPEGYICMLV